MRDATVDEPDDDFLDEAKIHASLAGCDLILFIHLANCIMLKSTHPLRDATYLLACNVMGNMLKSTHPLRDATAKYSVRLCKKTTFRISIFYFLIQTDEMNK